MKHCEKRPFSKDFPDRNFGGLHYSTGCSAASIFGEQLFYVLNKFVIILYLYGTNKVLTLSSVQGEILQSLDNKNAPKAFGIKSLECSDHCCVYVIFCVFTHLSIPAA
jgi:hypothetical protein